MWCGAAPSTTHVARALGEREEMRLVSSPAGLLVLLMAVGLSTGLLENQPSIDVTNFFTVSSATSTCGADTPPTSYEEPQNSDQFQTCGSGELHFSAENVLDGNSSTKWQSENGVSPVDVNFVIAEVELRICLFLNSIIILFVVQPGVSLSFQGVRLIFGSGLPRRLYLDTRLPGQQTAFETSRVFAVNASRDCEGEVSCQEFAIEEVLYT